MRMIKAYATNNLCYVAARKMTPKGIVVHSTGANNPTLKRYVDCPEEVGVNLCHNHWNVPMPEGRKVCVHAFIGYDKDNNIAVAELLPLDICCWGVGKGKLGSYNFSPAYIQFEICEDGLKDKVYYEKVFAAAVEYSAYLCEKYALKTEAIVGHSEAYQLGYGSNHCDPEHWMKQFGESMDDFRKAVDQKLDAGRTVAQCTQIHEGDLVSVSADARYYNGKQVPAWVRRQRWYVKEQPKGNRVVIDRNERKTNAICSPINAKYLTVVGRTTQPAGDCTQTRQLPYLIKVTEEGLIIYKNAGTNTGKAGRIMDKGVYTIVEEKQGIGTCLWGKLKSGAGWISLDCVTKL